jgi:hypothetical protein
MIEVVLGLMLTAGDVPAAATPPAPVRLAQMQTQRPRDYSGLRREELQREQQQRDAARLEDLRRQDQTRQMWRTERSRLDAYGSQLQNEQRQLDLELRQLDVERQQLLRGN